MLVPNVRAYCAYGEQLLGRLAIVEPVSDLNLILIGPPGAGKGTQAARLREDFDLSHIATGDLLRAHRERETHLGLRAARYMAEGRLVPDELVTEMVGDELASTDGGFLLDGFPRTPGQADALDEVLRELGRPLSAVLLIDVPDDVLVERISGRRLCPDGHVYHVKYDPPAREGICDVDGKPLMQREDDKPETVRKRLEVYHRETEPLVERYEGQGLLHRVDGTKSPDEVHDQLHEVIEAERRVAR
jgi:adenylate kinase